MTPRPLLAAAIQNHLGPDGQTLLYPLAEALRITVDPGGAAVILPIDVPDWLAEIGPYLQSIQPYVALENKSTNFQFKTILQSSITGRTWNAAVDLHAYVNTNTESVVAAYTTTANFGRRLRFALQAVASTGSAVEGGVVWCYLALRLRAA